MVLINPYAQAVFLKSAAKISQLPEDSGYEVAFAGRSNAGKSSALNTLTSIRQLARVSKTPGRTQLINLFTVQDADHRLVDLPGYGFAKVPQAVKRAWQANLAAYLDCRQSLSGLVVLIDARHPDKALDHEMIIWAVERSLPVHVLLTKVDKLSRGKAQSTLMQMKNRYELCPFFSAQLFSSLSKDGLAELIQHLNHWFNWPTH